MPTRDYAAKHRRARLAAGLDPGATSPHMPLREGTRVRGRAGALRNREGEVKRESWEILPHGQMVVRFDDPVVDRYQWIAVLREEVEPII